MEKKCSVCGKVFDAARYTAKYCSGGCRMKGFRDTVEGLSVTEIVSVTPLSVTKKSLALQKDVSVTDDEVGTPAKVLDLAIQCQGLIFKCVCQLTKLNEHLLRWD